MTARAAKCRHCQFQGLRWSLQRFWLAISHHSYAYESSMAVSSFRSLKQMVFGSICIRHHAPGSKTAGQQCETASCEIIEYRPMRPLSNENNTVLR